jgi:ketosteroid isomerase-like protein
MYSDATHLSDPAIALINYASAFSNKDSARIAGLLAERALVEIPMLQPNRLFGPIETRRGHDAIFSSLDTVAMDLGKPETKGNIAIACGTLRIERNKSIDESPVALVAETCESGLARVSFYMEARNKRLWVDQAIL